MGRIFVLLYGALCLIAFPQILILNANPNHPTTSHFNNATRLFVVGGLNGSAGGVLRSVDAFSVPFKPSGNVSSLPTPRFAHATVSINGLFFAVGGSDAPLHPIASVDVYLPPNDTWSPTTPMSTPRSYLGVCAFQNKIYAIGGQSDASLQPISSGEVFDPMTKLWKPTKNMTKSRYGHAVGVLGGQIYAVGGRDGNRALESVEKYEPNSDQWSAAPALRRPRAFLCVAVVNERLYAVGGVNEAEGVLKSAEVYDPKTATWTDIAAMAGGRWGAGAAPFGGLLYVVGGFNGSAPLDSFEMFDPVKNVWNNAPSLRTSVPRFAIGVALV